MGQENRVPQTVFDEWVNAVLSKVKSKATKLSQGFGFPEAQSIFHNKGVKKCFQNLHKRFVVTTADKAGNHIVFICKNFSHERVLRELGIAPGGPNTGNSTCKVCPKSINDVVESHVEFYKGFNLTAQINSSICHTSTGYQSYTKPHMEAVSSLPPADVLPHWFQKYSLHAWA